MISDVRFLFLVRFSFTFRNYLPTIPKLSSLKNIEFFNCSCNTEFSSPLQEYKFSVLVFPYDLIMHTFNSYRMRFLGSEIFASLNHRFNFGNFCSLVRTVFVQVFNHKTSSIIIAYDLLWQEGLYICMLLYDKECRNHTNNINSFRPISIVFSLSSGYIQFPLTPSFPWKRALLHCLISSILFKPLVANLLPKLNDTSFPICSEN